MKSFTYLRMAKLMLLVNGAPELASRYIQVRRRIRLLLFVAQEVFKSAKPLTNPLHLIRFSFPISVADESPEVVGLAESMVRGGTPIALHLDERHRHRGLPLAVIQRRLQATLHQHFTPVEVLNLYREFLEARCLVTHEQPRIAKIPGLLRKLAMVRGALEQQIDEWMTSQAKRRFTVLALARSLRIALRKIPQRPDVLVSFNGDVLRVGGEKVRVRACSGAGNVVLQHRKLRRVAIEARATVILDCHKDHWAAWVDNAGPYVFAYAGQEEIPE